MEFRLPVPALCREWRKREREEGVAGTRVPARDGGSVAIGESVAVGGALKSTGGGQRGKALVEGGVAYAALGAQILDAHRVGGGQQRGGDAFVEAGGRWRRIGRRLYGSQGQCIAVGPQLELDTGRRRRGAMFDRQAERIV